MTRPIEGCPQPDEPIRERAYTDRQLLELAAKAAGMGMDSWAYRGPFFGMLQVIDPLRMHESGTKGTAWNPLADDGDALRLAVKLYLFNGADFYHFRSMERFASQELDDCTATRRAIVRAAAAIAEGAKS